MQEKFLDEPFLPNNKVTLLALDGRCNGKVEGYPNLVEKLAKLKIRALEVPACPNLYNAIAHHPDMQFHPLDSETIIIAPNAGKGLAEKLLAEGFTLLEGKKILQAKYPADVPYNVVRIGQLALHNLKATDPVLREELEKRGVEFHHIAQGYSKCATVIINKKKIITEDKVLAKKAEDLGIKVLLIPSGIVRLPSLNYGFLGGASGLIAKKIIAITGQLTLSSSYLNIINYLKKANFSWEFLLDEVVLDVGSLIPLKERA